ncbi:MAG: TIGR02281 family clan AA aspartic protease [Proteobacteria bacterium]|nr:TIGR02281 family clan AA aspartic protease [Pseudomonadota bacterium]
MRSIIAFAIATLVVAAIVPRLYVGFSPAAVTQAAAPAAPQRSPSYGYATVTLLADRAGHFQTEGLVNGRRMGFIVDTGASVIAMRASDAARLGMRPMAREFTAEVKTANGSVRAAPAELDRVEIGNLTVRDVRALILPDELLPENLLGMSFLSRLRRVEMGNSRLTLEQ